MNNKLMEVKAQKEKVGDRILKTDPQKFLLAYAKEILRSMNIDCSNIDSIDKLKEVVYSLPKEQFKAFNNEMEIGKKMYENACIKLKHKYLHPFIKILKLSCSRGVLIGATVAGWINFCAPSAVPTLLGFFAGQDPNTWGKVIKLLLGAVSREKINHLLITGVSSGVGGAIGGIFSMVKGIKRGYDRKKASATQER